MSNFERKFGKYAIKNLTLILIICYVVGYVIELMNPTVFNYLTLDPYMILHGQVWRLLTWLIAPPSVLNLFTIIMLFFYYSIGSSLERAWGTYNYNVYIFSGILFTVIGAFLVYAFYFLTKGSNYAMGASFYASMLVSTYYVNMSIFLAFSATYPDNMVLLFFVIPLKVKWLGYVYGVFLVLECVSTRNPITIVMMVASLLNFVVFLVRKKVGRKSHKNIKKVVYVKEINKAVKPTTNTVNVCAVCGARSDEHPDYTYRYCSKCKGGMQYCQEHLFSHTHVE